MRGLGWGDDPDFDERAAIDSCSWLTEAMPSRPTATQEKIVRFCYARARRLGLHLPDRLRFLWRAGVPHAPDGVTKTEGKEMVVYVRATLTRDQLKHVLFHELRHVDQVHAGYGCVLSYQQAERDAEAFAHYAMRAEDERRGTFRRNAETSGDRVWTRGLLRSGGDAARPFELASANPSRRREHAANPSRGGGIGSSMPLSPAGLPGARKA